MKPTYEIILDELDLIVKDLQEQVQEMKAMSSSVRASLDTSESSKPKRQVNQVALTYLVGPKRLKLKQRIIRKQEGLKEHPSYQRWLSKPAENQ